MDKICAAVGDCLDFGNYDYADYFCLLIYNPYEKILINHNAFDGLYLFYQLQRRW